MSEVKKYSILTFNFNNYEIMREPEELDEDCEYIYVTDNPNLKSDKWKIVIENLEGTGFDKSFYVRYNPFKYVNTDVCICIDSSMQIHKSLRKLYEDFMNSGAEIALNVHPERDNVLDEYITWAKFRQYPKSQIEKALKLFNAAGYDPKSKGLYQSGLRILKKTKQTLMLNEYGYETLKKISEPNSIDRLDQTIFSFVVNYFFKDLKVFPFSQQVFQSDYINYCFHNSLRPVPFNRCNNKLQGFCQGNLVNLYRLV